MLKIFLSFSAFILPICLWSTSPDFETNGDVAAIYQTSNSFGIHGWIDPMYSPPIDGFEVNIGEHLYFFDYLPIKQTQEFILPIYLSSEQRALFDNQLIKVTPLNGNKRGHSFYHLHKPSLELPSNKDEVGCGDFIKTSTHMLGLMEGRGGLKPADAILDVGCGLGRMTYALAYFLDKNAVYEGFDVDANFILRAKEVYENDYPNFHFQCIDAANSLYNPKGELGCDFVFPYADHTFDFVFLTSVFTHMLSKDVRHYLSEIHRVLKPGGTCFFTSFTLDEQSKRLIKKNKTRNLTFSHRLKGCFVQELFYPEAVVAYDYDRIMKWITNLGFEKKGFYKGLWRGITKDWVSVQDIFVITKHKDI